MCDVLEARAKKGALDMLISLVRDGLLDLSEAARRAELTEQEFVICMEQEKK